MFLNCIREAGELTVKQLASFSNHSFASESNDFALLDINETAERIAYSEEKNEYSERYYTDVNIKGTFKCSELTITVTSLLGGLIADNGKFTLDTVKSVKFPLSYITDKYTDEWLCETKCSAYLLCRARKLDNIGLRLICVNPETLEKRKFTYTYTVRELELHFTALLSEWAKWTKLYDEHISSRNIALQNVDFPYPCIRDGQDIIIREVSSAIAEKRPLFINAPTGIGKTAAVLYPSLKALGSGSADRIFYLTSKNSLHSVVIDACRQVEKSGCRIRVLSLVSRNKMCPSGHCDKRTCARLRGHAERLKSALYELVSNEFYLTFDVLKCYAEKYNVCPFELARRASLFSDVVICDYNYIFDPSVSRLNLFSAKGKEVLLIDEAHNLVERVKEMHSSQLLADKIIEVTGNIADSEYKKALKRFTDAFDEIRSDDLFQAEPLDRNSVDNIIIEANALFGAFQRLVCSDAFSVCDGRENLLKLFDNLKRFVSMLDELNDNYIVFFNERGNPSILLADTGKAVRTVCRKMGFPVLFSATLAPEEYYRHMLGAAKRDVYINLSSPFPRDNFKVVSYAVSTRYSEREATLADIVEVIYAAVSRQRGNYMVFLPSYSYMNTVAHAFSSKYKEITIVCEKQGMTTDDKKAFINSFAEERNDIMTAFAVMGGNFSEGVDLVGNKLSGAVIVGLGVLPPERSRELVAGYFNDRFYEGVKFAYMYPGMNKVFQAGGRVIRSETDKGFLVVVDDRFLSEDYLENLPESWRNISKASSPFAVSDIIEKFWAE